MGEHFILIGLFNVILGALLGAQIRPGPDLADCEPLPGRNVVIVAFAELHAVTYFYHELYNSPASVPRPVAGATLSA